MNAKRVYRIMSENILLLHDKPSRPQREHKGRISVRKATSVDVLMALSSVAMMAKKSGLRSPSDCCDREAIDWASNTGGYNKATVQDVMLGAIEKLFGD